MSMGVITIPKGVLYTEADVRFMQGMIAHPNAQAHLHVAHGQKDREANPRVLKFANKIDQSQTGGDPAHAGLASRETIKTAPDHGIVAHDGRCLECSQADQLKDRSTARRARSSISNF